MNTSEIRQAFLDFFAQKAHKIVSSSSLVPAHDPSLLFTNAGMVQFKDTFLGVETRPYMRAVSVQRCLRAGGKHNDLENVGYTARHHTFFEMLGNFSFGDYFKHEAIAFAWEFLTKILQLPAERLWITVYEKDDEAANIWLHEIGVSPSRFSRCGDADNFWSMGDTGPCGPCSEIFYDHGADVPGGPPGSPDADGDRYIEIWNLVFMQYNRDSSGTLHLLPKPSVDTGMGLERIAAVVQNVHNNYDIDSFQYLIQALVSQEQLTDREHPSLKVIVDHIRACAFLITDGVNPSNEGRGYVLRRIIRRAVRHGHQLGLTIPFFHKLVSPLVTTMGAAYPELIAAQQLIEKTLMQEENQFAHTLEHGLRLLHEAILSLPNKKELPGNIAFKLYDTYGFPLDLTADVVREKGLIVDQVGFESCMAEQRKLSQAASAFNVDYTNSAAISESSVFCGYEQDHIATKILAIVVDGLKVEKITLGTKAAIILETTPFYAESGGQVGDPGFLQTKDALFRVDDTQRQGQAILHYGELVSGELVVAQSITAEVSTTHRAAVRLNHTATHLLHAALKIVFGPQVQQKGSLVEATRARFDFSHSKPMTPDECLQIESLVNEQIRANLVVDTELMLLDEAKNAGAVALFGEKYQDTVRVLSLGEFSKELCGGTHAQRTGDIGLFKIIAEYGVANGIRRLEMLTGTAALDWVNQQMQILNEVSLTLNTTPNEVTKKLLQSLQVAKLQEKSLQQAQQQLALQFVQQLLDEIKIIELNPAQKINLLVKQIDNTHRDSLRIMLDQLKAKLQSVVIVLYTIVDNNLQVIAGVSKDLVGSVPGAPVFVRHLCGHGGGRDEMAQGGGAVPNDFAERIAQIDTIDFLHKR